MPIYTENNIERHVRHLLGRESKQEMIPGLIKRKFDETKTLKEQIKYLNKKKKKYKDSYKEDPDAPLQIEMAEIEKQLFSLEESLEIKRAETEEAIKNYSAEVLSKIRKKAKFFKIETFTMGGKTVFRTANFESEILLSLITEDIKHFYGILPADRNQIVCQLKQILDNSMPKYLIRADVKSCFENVPFATVLEKLEVDGYISSTSLNFLKRIHAEISANSITGVPRGLAFSSYLVELYFQTIDRKIKNITGAFFYKRYVDDIILIISAVNRDIDDTELQNSNKAYYWSQLKDIFDNRGLKLHDNDSKKRILFLDSSVIDNFDYLGYKFQFLKSGLKVGLSSAKKQRYVETIDKIIRHYNRTARDNQRSFNSKDKRLRKREQPLRRLFGQLSAFTGNGALVGVKSNILVGIYYSNQHVSSIEDFRELDKTLSLKIDQEVKFPDNLFQYSSESNPKKTIDEIRNVLKRFSFERGFAERRFCKGLKYCRRLREIKKLS